MRLLVFICLLLFASDTASAQIALGSRHVDRSFDGVMLRIYTYRPSCSSPGLLLVFHGTGRDAERYRDHARRMADQRCLVVVAPLFDRERFSNAQYQRGGIADSRGNLLPASQWTTRFVAPIAAWARAQIGGSPRTYLFGHSAGAQFLSRVAAYEGISGIRRFVVANPSTYALPSLSEPVPFGFQGFASSSVQREALRRYLALPLTIYLGELDNDPNAADLDVSAAAMRQGAHRRERGERTFAMGRSLARANGWTFNWRLTNAPGVGHAAGGMLRSSATQQAFGF